MASQMLETSVTYTIPLDHFTSTTSNVVTVSDQLLVGSHSILPLHISHSTMVPQATTISTGNVVITQDPIGTPLLLRSNPSLPPEYNALNTSIDIPTHNPSSGSRIFVPPRYNVASHFVPTPTQVLSWGPYVPPPPLYGGSNCPGPSGSNLVGGHQLFCHFWFSNFCWRSTSSWGETSIWGATSDWGKTSTWGGSLKLEAIN
jgi:hypothetical protein